MISREDMDSIKHELDDRYVTINDCNEIQKTSGEKLNKIDKDVSLLSQNMKTIKWILSTIAVSVIGVLVTAVANLIIK